MENHFAIKSISILTLITIFFSCADPTTIGSELQDSVNAFSTDTITVRMTTIPEDSVKVFDSNENAAFSTLLCGNLPPTRSILYG
jgi:peptide methionine sulfoxide reductase MsrA